MINPSAFDRIEVKIWSYFLKVSSGFEKNRVLGVIRFVSLPITFFSALISGLLSLVYESFDFKLFLVNTLGLLLAHAASNVINDFWDYKKNVDSPEYFRNVYGVHPVSVLGEKTAFALGLILSLLAFLCGLYLFINRGIWVLILAGLGFIFLFSYSGPPFNFKYRGLGELIVFLVWGPIMICGGFYVITGFLNKEIIVASIPYGITASLILFGKHLDKIEQDSQKGARTLPVILGKEKTLKLCKILIFSPYVFVFVFSLISGKFWVLLAFLSLPRAIKIARGLDIPKPSDVNSVPDFYPKEFWPMWYVGGAFILNTDFALTYIFGLFCEHLF